MRLDWSGGQWKTPATILVCGTCILFCSFGIRQTYGLFLAPISEANSWNIAIFSFSMGLQVLVWGLTQPLWGMVADRFGAGRVVSLGSILYAFGLLMMAKSATILEIHFSTGFLTGIAMSATGFPIILAVIGRSVDAKRRSYRRAICAFFYGRWRLYQRAFDPCSGYADHYSFDNCISRKTGSPARSVWPRPKRHGGS